MSWQCHLCGTVYADWKDRCPGPHAYTAATDPLTIRHIPHCTCRRLPGGHLEPTSAVCPVHG